MADAQPQVDYNWNSNYGRDGVVFCHLTDFCLTQVAPDGQSRSITSLLLANPGNAKQKYTLTGNLINKDGPCVKKPFRIPVTSYYIDVGNVGSIAMDDPLRGFWMVGEDEDVRYKLVYPSAPEYIPYARILDLATYSHLFGLYSHAHETGRCIRMTNFVLTNKDSGSKQTLILPKNTKTVSVLKGTITINPESLSGTGLDVFIGNTDKARCKQLPMQTYINSTYVVDFGDSTEPKTVPILWVEDLYKTWIKLEAPCHRDYRSDYNLAMSRTINNVEAYNWDADGNEVWRHVTNFRLTTLTGQLHDLEITAENSMFILWGDLQPPAGSACPPIPVKLYVNTFSVDTGTERHDVNMGIWMQEMKGSWYKLDLPAAPDYKETAAPVFTNATKFLELYDALFYQDEDGAKWCPSDEDESKGFLLKWPIKQIHQACNPKFDLKWVARNKDFVYKYLVNDFNLENSLDFIESVEALGNDIHVDAPHGHGNNSHRAVERHSVEPATGKNKHPVVQKSGQEKAGERSDKAMEKTAQHAPIVPANRTVPAGVTSVSSIEPAQSKKRPLETEARAEKVAKLLASGSASSGNSSGSGSDAQKKNGTVEPASAPVAAVKAIKKKQLLDLDTISYSTENSSVQSVSGKNETQSTTSITSTASVNNTVNPAKRPRLEIPARPPTTKPMPASFYNNVAPGVPVPPRPVEQKGPPPLHYTAQTQAQTQPAHAPSLSLPTAGNTSPRPPVYGGTSSAAAPNLVPSVNTDRNGAETVRQLAPLHPDAPRRSASRESDRSYQSSGNRQPSLDSRYQPREPSFDRGTNASDYDSRSSERILNDAVHELVEGHKVCGYCRGLPKQRNCTNHKHIHGQYLLVFRLKGLEGGAPGRVERDTSRSRSTDRDYKDGGGYQRNRATEGRALCRFCRSKEKFAKCRNDNHIDGQFYEEPHSNAFSKEKDSKFPAPNYGSAKQSRDEVSPRAGQSEPSRAPHKTTRPDAAFSEQTMSGGAGRGRGKHSTLPAWMTAQSSTDSTGHTCTLGQSHNPPANPAAPVHSASYPGQFADPSSAPRESLGDDHTLVDSEAELNSLLGISSDEETDSIPPKANVTLNKRASGGKGSDTESGEVSDDSAGAATPPPRPAQKITAEKLGTVTIKFPSQTSGASISGGRTLSASPQPAQKISTPSVVSAPPPKPSRFASDGNFRVAAVSSAQTTSKVSVQPPPQLTVPQTATSTTTATTKNGAVIVTKPPALQSQPAPTVAPSTVPAAAAPAPKSSRFATDGNFKVTPVHSASAVPSASAPSAAPVARSTLSILNAAVNASATSVSPSQVRPTAPPNAPLKATSSPAPVDTPQSSSGSTGGSSSSPIIIDLENSTELSKRVVVKDEMSLERSKYAKKQYSSPVVSVVPQEDHANGVSDKSLSIHKPTTSIGGKWGALMAKPSAGAASPRIVEGTEISIPDAGHVSTSNHTNHPEMVRLGVREDDPKKRLAMSNRHAGGVYAGMPSSTPRGTSGSFHVSALDAAPVYSDDTLFEPAVINLKAVPTKGILRINNNGTSSKPAPSATSAASAASAIIPASGAAKRVVWSDTIEGGHIHRVRYIEKAVYVNDELVGDAPRVILLPFAPDVDGNIRVQWNDGDSQSP